MLNWARELLGLPVPPTEEESAGAGASDRTDPASSAGEGREAAESPLGPELEAAFSAATAYVGSGVLSLSDEQKLRFYGLFKQARAGRCTTSRPFMVDMVGCAKWDAWNGLGDMASVEAALQYVSGLRALAPEWTADAEVPDAAPEKPRGGGGGGGTGPVMSTMAGEVGGGGGDETDEEAEEKEALEQEKDLPPAVAAAAKQEREDRRAFIKAAKAGDVDALRAMVARGVDVDVVDKQGRTALHWAVDSELLDAARLLLESGAAVDARDEDLASPLMYAVLVAHRELVALLMSFGADPELPDESGATPLGEAEEAGEGLAGMLSGASGVAPPSAPSS